VDGEHDHDDVEQPDVPLGQQRHSALGNPAGERPAIDGVVVVIGKETEDALRCNQAKHQEHDGAAERIVAEEMARPSQQEVDAIAQRRPWRVGEGTEA
jgi:hypothetical protein